MAFGPSIIDFPVSETFRDGYADYYGWPIPPRTETLREARIREDHEAFIASQAEYVPKKESQRAQLKQIWDKLHEVEADNTNLRNKIASQNIKQRTLLKAIET